MLSCRSDLRCVKASTSQGSISPSRFTAPNSAILRFVGVLSLCQNAADHDLSDDLALYLRQPQNRVTLSEAACDGWRARPSHLVISRAGGLRRARSPPIWGSRSRLSRRSFQAYRNLARPRGE